MSTYKRCSRCVMDTTDPDIFFDEKGFCNHCTKYFDAESKFVFKHDEGKKKLKEIVERIKESGRGKDYDCIFGVSGGVDSSYVAFLAWKNGLRVLLTHFDNGWNSPVGEKNVQAIVNKTGFNIIKGKADFDEFRDLQIAFLKASVVDIEMITDHAIAAWIYKLAAREGIKYILSGTNFVTESIMPKAWGHQKNDLTNLKSIHKRFGKVKLRTFPTMSLLERVSYRFFKGIRFVSLLDYADYDKQEAKRILKQEFGWQDYGGKHHESIFTKFYQSYILPRKFGIDKRKAHLSNLICSGQISRSEAVEELEKALYSEEDLAQDKQYVLGRLGLSEEEFEQIMDLPIKKHSDYGSDEWIYEMLRRLERVYRFFGGTR